MQIVIDIPKRIYDHILRTNMLVNSDRLEVTEAIINGTPLPKCTTNGDMIKAMFNISDSEIDEGLSTTYIYTKTRVLKGGSQDRLREQITFDREWWNAPYKGSED